MSSDQEKIAAIFRLVDREVWIVTAATGARRGGLVATWVMQAALDSQDPLALVGLAPNHFTRELIEESQTFALHLLGESHINLVWQFGLSSGRLSDKFADLETTVAKTGAPILVNCLAWLDCRVITSYDAGDRIYFWGQVVSGEQSESGRPLRESAVLAAASDEQKRQLRAGLEQDIEQLRPMAERWRRLIEQG